MKKIDIALAGLLYDIGKLEQRAKTNPWNPAPGIESPTTPVHATWTAYFAQNYLPSSFRKAGLEAAYHHKTWQSYAPDNSLSILVALADKLSAGERADQPETYPSKKPPQQLISIFDRLSLKTALRDKDFHYLPLKPLSLDEETIFAKKAETENAQGDAYENLRSELEIAAKRNPGDDESYLENLLGAMQKLTWCVPSAYYHSLPDVSLYDHSRMTAALAVSLAEKSPEEINALHEAVKRQFLEKPEKGDEKLLTEPALTLIGGDISGVQKFIYTVSSKQAAKTLRGRSFYLQLLTEAILRYVLRELDLPYTNVIYSGGGHFFLLAPLSAKEKLQEIKKSVSEKLLKHHGTALYLALGYAEVSANDLQKGNFSAAWNRMYSDLNRTKKQKYTELGEEFHRKVFLPEEHGGNQEKTCSICGRESEDVKKIEGSDEDRRCALCASFAEDIGKELPKSRFVAIGLLEPREQKRKNAFTALREFGVLVQLAQNKEIQFEEKVERAVIWALDDEGRYPSIKDVPTAYATRYTVNLIPMATDKYPLPFDELQEEAEGISRLGVLRMDVDNLGDIFKDGLGERASLARMATLSFQVSLFFEGWLKNICEKDEYKNLIYAVYTGGDDLFLIGPWHLMPYLAQDISDNLAEYTNNHPDIHISGGLAFIGGKYPIYQAAEDAEELLDSAKNKKGKNAFAFLDYAWKWDEFREIRENFVLIHEIVEGRKPDEAKDNAKKGPHAIMQTLRELTVQKDDSLRKNSNLLYGPWIWQGMYRIHRMMDREKDKEKAGKLAEIQESLNEENYKNLRKWGTSARWAQVYLRKSKQE